MVEKIARILFLSTGNAARSIFAEYLLRKIAKGRFEAYSAGSRPTGKVDPFALRVLKEFYDIDCSEARSKSWDEFRTTNFDFVITVCDKDHADCPIFPGQPMIARWDIPDPAITSGTEEERLREYRLMAQQLQRRLELLCALPIEQLDHIMLTEMDTER
jgi:arsenate reductase